LLRRAGLSSLSGSGQLYGNREDSMRTRLIRSLPIIVALAVISLGAVQAQSTVRPVVELGLEPLIAHDYPAGTMSELRSFSPGYRLALGIAVGTPQSAWSGGLHVSGLWRSYSPSAACPAGGLCAQSLSYHAYGLETKAQYSLRQSGFFRPYLGGGFGFYATRQTEQTPGAPATNEDQVRPAALVTTGLRLGHGTMTGLFIEATLIQFVGSASQSTLLPLQVGWRFQDAVKPPGR
jgi:hypothetical protein